MKIKGLSANVWDRHVEVYDRDGHCPLLQICHLCDFYHPTYFLCPSGHVTCAECQGRVKANVDEAHCKACGIHASRISIATDLVLSINFVCGCGAWGTLEAIKAHRASDDFRKACDENRDAENPIMLDNGCDLDEIDMLLEAMSEDTQNVLDRVREVQVNYRVKIVSKERLNESWRKIVHLKERGDKVLDFYHALKGVYDQIRALTDTIISPSTIKKFYIKPLLEGRIQENVFLTSFVQILMRLVLNENGSADLHVKADFRKGFHCPENMIGKVLSFRLHDLSGYILKEAAFVIQSDGFLRQEEPADHKEKFPGFRMSKDFVASPRFYGPVKLLSDSLKVSVALYP